MPIVKALINKNQIKPQKIFNFGSSNIPHFQKRLKGGEDAWCAQNDLIIVADGVGGWSN